MSPVAQTTEKQVVTVTINGREVQGRAGQTILEVAQAAGVDIPTLCHDPRLEPYGACRMCLVEVEGARGPMAACGTAIREGMVIETHTDKINKMRKFVLELLLTNHPLDCPVCEAAGDCRLQDYAYEYLVDMVPWGWRPPEASDPGDHPNIAHFSSRCILCGRCVRICREVMGIGCWGYLNRGYDSEVDTPYRLPLKEVECVSCGQCVSTCPVGAITGQRSPQGARAWQTSKTVSTCSYCADGCRIVLHGYQGKVVKTDAQTGMGLNQGNLCVKGRFGQGFGDAGDRVTKPLVRNAKGKLEEATWEKALSLVAEKLTNAASGGKGGGVGAICGTSCTNEAGYLLQKLMRAVLGSNNVDAVDHAEMAVVEDKLDEVLGGVAATMSRSELAEADVILLAGANLTESHPVLALEVIKALRSGKSLIVIDPRRTDLAKKATIHLQIKPGTDLAALRAMMRVILDLELVDEKFVKESTDCYNVLEGSLEDLDLSVEAATCGVEADLLGQAAALLGGAEAAATLFGSGIARGAKAANTVSALVDLALVTGNIGRPGAGIVPLRAGANSQGLYDMGVRPNRLPGRAGVGADETVAKLEEAWGVTLQGLGKGSSVTKMLESGKGDLEALWVLGADPALALADEKSVREALDKIGFVVVQDSFLSDTAEYADVVLPAAVATEDEGTFTNGERMVQRVRAGVSPAGESRPDWQIVLSVAQAMGTEWDYACPGAVMAEISQTVSGYECVDYGALESEGVQTPCGDGQTVGTALLYADGFPVGKAVLSAVDGAVAGVVTDNKFPLALISGTVREHHGTGVRTRRVSGLTKLVKEAVLEVSKADAEKAKVSDGTRVRVVSQRGGSVEVVAKVSPRVPDGVVFLPGFSSEAPVTRLQGPKGAGMPAIRLEAI